MASLMIDQVESLRKRQFHVKAAILSGHDVFLRSCRLQRKVCVAVNLVYFFSSSEAIAVADK